MSNVVWTPKVGEFVERRGRWGFRGPLIRVAHAAKTKVILENGETYRCSGQGWRRSPVNQGHATIHSVPEAEVLARKEAQRAEQLRELAVEELRTASPEAVRECARILGLEVKS